MATPCIVKIFLELSAAAPTPTFPAVARAPRQRAHAKSPAAFYFYCQQTVTAPGVCGHENILAAPMLP